MFLQEPMDFLQLHKLEELCIWNFKNHLRSRKTTVVVPEMFDLRNLIHFPGVNAFVVFTLTHTVVPLTLTIFPEAFVVDPVTD